MTGLIALFALIFGTLLITISTDGNDDNGITSKIMRWFGEFIFVACCIFAIAIKFV